MANTLKGKKIVLGITGSIAAYKACYIIRGLIKQGAEVQVVITPAGKEFITPITLSALTSKPVISEFFAQRDGTWNSHVDLGLWADAMLIAPATASTIGKMANGVADNMLEEPEVIIKHLANYFAGKEGDLRGKTIMITAGPTYEKIDPVRFIGNYSSGKMGFAIADECAARGAKVIMISGPVQQQLKYPVRWFPVESADQMYNAACSFFAEADAAILSAAVADFTPEQVADAKIKREKEGEMTLRLKPTKDIAACLGQMKKERQVLVGFALETNDEQHNAEDKLRRKNLDFIVLNSLNDKGAGFRYDTNKISIIDRESKADFPLKSKAEVAADIVDCLVEVLENK